MYSRIQVTEILRVVPLLPYGVSTIPVFEIHRCSPQLVAGILSLWYGNESANTNDYGYWVSIHTGSPISCYSGRSRNSPFDGRLFAQCPKNIPACETTLYSTVGLVAETSCRVTDTLDLNFQQRLILILICPIRPPNKSCTRVVQKNLVLISYLVDP